MSHYLAIGSAIGLFIFAVMALYLGYLKRINELLEIQRHKMDVDLWKAAAKEWQRSSNVWKSNFDRLLASSSDEKLKSDMAAAVLSAANDQRMGFGIVEYPNDII